MPDLNVISETALITLRSRVIESKKNNPLIKDKIGIKLYGKIKPLFSLDVQKRIFESKFPVTLTTHIALRARKYDQLTNEFINNNPDGLVVNLGCGMDTRYWRVSVSKNNYIEIDLPEIINLKKEILGASIPYKMYGISILDQNWISYISSIQNKNILFLAEGLFMYLNKKNVKNIFRDLSENFSSSRIIFEIVNKKYTQGYWKKIIESKMKRSVKSKAGSSFIYGIKNAKEIENYHTNIKIINEWSYFEDSDIRPKILYYLKNCKFMTRSQWTVIASINYN